MYLYFYIERYIVTLLIPWRGIKETYVARVMFIQSAVLQNNHHSTLYADKTSNLPSQFFTHACISRG